MSNKLSQRLSQMYNSNKLPWIIIFVGIFLRLFRYLYNHSLWFDESRNAINIFSRSLSEIIPPPSDLTISSPIGFWMIEKFAILIFGSSEYALRLFPLLCGVVSLFLFYKVAKYYIKPKAIPIALGLFAVLDPLVIQSSYLKPYSSDVAFALLLYLLTIYFQSRKLNIFRIILYGISGAIIMWFSHPSVFVLAGIGVTLTILYSVRKEWSKMKGLLIASLIWVSGFLVVYLIYTRPLMFNFLTLTNDKIVWTASEAFMPFPPMSLSDIRWFLELPLRIFAIRVGLTFYGIATLVFIAGCISIFSEKKEHFFILMSPLIITLLMSGLRKYTFNHGPILFLVPFILLFIAEGTEYIREKLSHSSKIIGIIFVCLLFLHPLSIAAYHVYKPFFHDDTKPVLKYIKDNWQNGDIIYVYYMSQFAFEYYSKYNPIFHFNENDYIIWKSHKDWYATYKREKFTGFWNKDKPFSQPYTEVLKEFVENINKLRGHKRVWFLFTSVVSRNGVADDKFIIIHLKNIGRQLDSFERQGMAAVYLYDLSEKASIVE